MNNTKRIILAVCVTFLAVVCASIYLIKSPATHPQSQLEQDSLQPEVVQSYPLKSDSEYTNKFSQLDKKPSVRKPSLIPLSELNLSDAVQDIINLSHKKAGYNEYRDAMRKLTRNLSADDTYALMSFLNKKAADHSYMRPIAFNGVKNDVLDVLLRQEVLPKGIGAQLVEMYNDKSFDTMWRDYCVQFITNYYERRWIYADSSQTASKTDDTENTDRKAIEAVYWDAIKETDTTIAGTALLGLTSIARTGADIDRKRIKKAIEDILAEPACGEPTRITALRLAGSLGCDKILPEARIIAQTGETVTLRMAAIATIGDLGTSNDIELLESLSADKEPRIRAIAAKSLTKLMKG